MRLYEIVYIFDETLDEDGVNKKLEKFHPLVLGKSGEVVEVDHWGVRQMAYPVKKHGSGYYIVAQVRAEADGLPEFERVLRLDVELLRYLIVLNEGEPTTGHSLLGPPPARSPTRTRGTTRRRMAPMRILPEKTRVPIGVSVLLSSAEAAAAAAAWRDRSSNC